MSTSSLTAGLTTATGSDGTPTMDTTTATPATKTVTPPVSTTPDPPSATTSSSIPNTSNWCLDYTHSTVYGCGYTDGHWFSTRNSFPPPSTLVFMQPAVLVAATSLATPTTPFAESSTEQATSAIELVLTQPSAWGQELPASGLRAMLSSGGLSQTITASDFRSPGTVPSDLSGAPRSTIAPVYPTGSTPVSRNATGTAISTYGLVSLVDMMGHLHNVSTSMASSVGRVSVGAAASASVTTSSRSSSLAVSTTAGATARASETSGSSSRSMMGDVVSRLAIFACLVLLA
jgi:hypothetical protein